MKFEFFIARRYLLKGRKNSFISTMSLVSVLGITIGVAALIIALALMNGYHKEIRTKILSSTAHIMINGFIGEGVKDYEKVVKDITENIKDIKSAGPVVYSMVLLKSGNKSSGVYYKGLDMELKSDSSWKNRIVDGRKPETSKEIMIGRALSEKMLLMRGDKVLLITPQHTLAPDGVRPKMRKVTVTGIFESGIHEIDNNTVVADLASAQKLFKLKERVNYIQVFLENIFDADRVADVIRERYKGKYSIITWKDLNASLYSALDLEKTILFFTLNLIIVVASLNIIAGLIVLVVQKIRDIGILLSYGATGKMISRIFFIQGGIIGLAGTLCGTLLGTIFVYFANRFQLIRIPAELYQMSYVPFRLDILEVGAVILTAMLISLMATIYPSGKAAGVNVVEAVKNE